MFGEIIDYTTRSYNRDNRVANDLWRIQSLAIKVAVSVSVIRKSAVVSIPIEIQKFVWYWSGIPENLP